MRRRAFGDRGGISERLAARAAAARSAAFLVVSTTGSGTVRSSPAGIDCGLVCSALLAEGTQVVLTPAPDPGWRFAGWGGGCTGLGGCAVRLTADVKVFVTFVALPPAPAGKHTVTVTPSGAGSGRISSAPAGIDCGAACSAQFDDNASVVLTATPAPGSTFSGWTGACSGSSTCQLTVGSDLQVGAAFDGTPPPSPKTSGWVSPAGSDVVAIATDPSGNTVALVVDPSQVSLSKLDPAGKAIWTRTFDGSAGTNVDPGTMLATDANGDVYLFWASQCADFGCNGTIDFGDGATPAAALVKLDPDGNLLWEHRLPEDGAELAVNANGDAVFRSWRSTDTSTTDVVRVDQDGTEVWTKTSRGLGHVAIDAAGNVLVGAVTSQTDPIFGQTFQSDGPVVAKLASADGSVVWARRIAEGVVGEAPALGVDASGAVVAAGDIGGAFDFGGEHHDVGTLPAAPSIFVFDADGSERVAREISPAVHVLVAVDPSGRASFAGSMPGMVTVTTFDLAGVAIATSSFQPTGAGAAIAVHSIAINPADHNTVLGGNFAGTVDFGSGPTAAQAQQGYVANLGK
ncbi:MAG: InlB B-repeat-containing protein [Myxococcales bacterium]